MKRAKLRGLKRPTRKSTSTVLGRQVVCDSLGAFSVCLRLMPDHFVGHLCDENAQSLIDRFGDNRELSAGTAGDSTNPTGRLERSSQTAIQIVELDRRLGPIVEEAVREISTELESPIAEPSDREVAIPDEREALCVRLIRELVTAKLYGRMKALADGDLWLSAAMVDGQRNRGVCFAPVLVECSQRHVGLGQDPERATPVGKSGAIEHAMRHRVLVWSRLAERSDLASVRRPLPYE